jgi:hypothetical protein
MQIHEITLKEAAGGAGAFGQMAQQLQKPTVPAKSTQSNTQGTITPTATGLTHAASLNNPNPRSTPPDQQQLWDREYRRLTNQFPGLTTSQYQAAMLKRSGSARRPGGPAPAPATTQQVAQPAPSSQPSPVTKSTVRPVQALGTTPVQYPPITLGTGPNAQVYVNKGRGYVDSKTGKPMPPSIVKAMGL